MLRHSRKVDVVSGDGQSTGKSLPGIACTQDGDAHAPSMSHRGALANLRPVDLVRIDVFPRHVAGEALGLLDQAGPCEGAIGLHPDVRDTALEAALAVVLDPGCQLGACRPLPRSACGSWVFPQGRGISRIAHRPPLGRVGLAAGAFAEAHPNRDCALAGGFSTLVSAQSRPGMGICGAVRGRR